MSSVNQMSFPVQIILLDALLATAARVEREKQALEQNQQDSERLSAIFGAPVVVDASFSFDISFPVGADAIKIKGEMHGQLNHSDGTRQLCRRHSQIQP